MVLVAAGVLKSLGGQECADADSYNDRLLYTMNEDVTISCFGLYGGPLCSSIYVPDPVAVTFQLDTTNVPCDGNPFVTGTFDGWSSGGLEPTLDETLGAYTGTRDFMPGEYQYKFVCNGWTAQEDVPAECGVDNGPGGFNRHVMVEEGSEPLTMHLTEWGGCPVPPTPPHPLTGTWKLAPVPGAMKVGVQGPNGGQNWWRSDEGHITGSRACQFDDEFVFNADGSFQNILGTETFVEPWQGNDPEGCAALLLLMMVLLQLRGVMIRKLVQSQLMVLVRFLGIPKAITGASLEPIVRFLLLGLIPLIFYMKM